MKYKYPFLIAEIGVNHNGKLFYGKKLINLVSKSNVRLAKIQIFNPEIFVLKNTKLAKYQKENTKNKYLSQYDMLNNLCLSESDINKLSKFAKNKNVDLFASAFDISSFKFAYKLNSSIIKIPSGEITNFPLLEIIGSKNKLTLLSTGMSTELEIASAIKVLFANGLNKKNIVLMHCISNYPTKFQDLNLNYIPYMRKKFKCDVGFSDHSLGIEASLAAVALGAKVIEKHFTYDVHANGPDHSSSIEFDELKKLNIQINNISLSMGKPKKIITKNEIQTKKIVRKMIVASKKIFKGDVFSDQNLMTIRPMNGTPASDWYKLIGKKSNKNYEKFQKIIIKK